MEEVEEEDEANRERRAPLAGPVPDGEEDLKALPSTLEVAEAAEPVGEGRAEERPPAVDLIPEPVDRNRREKMPMDPVQLATHRVSSQHDFLFLSFPPLISLGFFSISLLTLILPQPIKRPPTQKKSIPANQFDNR